jgi:hypothetical protein
MPAMPAPARSSVRRLSETLLVRAVMGSSNTGFFVFGVAAGQGCPAGSASSLQHGGRLASGSNELSREEILGE